MQFVSILWCSGKLECPCKVFLHLGDLLEVKRLLEPAHICCFESITSDDLMPEGLPPRIFPS